MRRGRSQPSLGLGGVTGALLGHRAVQLPRVGAVILQEYLEGSLPSSAAISVEKVITLAEVILGAPGLAAP